jgi:hypothetical protein
MARWQKPERHPREMQGGGARFASMTGRKIKRTLSLSRHPTHLLKEMFDAFVCGLHTPVLIRTHHEVRLQAPTGGQELEDIGPSITDMDANARRSGGTKRLDTLLPDICFLPAHTPLGSGFAFGGRNTNEGMLLGTSQHLTAAWLNGQHSLQVPSPPVSISNLSQAAHLATMREIQIGGILHQQHERQAVHPLAGRLPMRLDQRIKGHIGFIKQSIHGFCSFPSLCLGGPRCCGITRHLSRCQHGSSRTAHVLKLRLSKSDFGPRLRVQDLLRFHLSILPLC